MDSIADRATGEPARVAAVAVAVNAVDEASAWVVDVASGRVVRRPLNPREAASNQSTGLS
jgi:hypothetical protein